MKAVLNVKKTHLDAKLPYKENGNACYDISCVYNDDYTDKDENGTFFILKSGERKIFSTGLILYFPTGYHGKLRPRSGLAAKYGIDVMAGMIDNSYQGELKVILINTGNKEYKIYSGDRICQLKLEKDITLDVLEVKDTEEIGTTTRGQNGFGSSGR